MAVVILVLFIQVVKCVQVLREGLSVRVTLKSLAAIVLTERWFVLFFFLSSTSKGAN